MALLGSSADLGTGQAPLGHFELPSIILPALPELWPNSLLPTKGKGQPKN